MRLAYETRVLRVSTRCVVARVQEVKEEHWRKCVRRKKARKRFLQKRREGLFPPPPPPAPLFLPADALRWRGEPWKAHRQELASLQKQIYRAALSGDTARVDALQNDLVASKPAKSLAVRRVALTHPQRRVPGVDGVHTLDAPHQRALAEELYIDGVSDEFLFRRQEKAWRQERGADDEGVNICVCTMRDRAKQVLLSWALKPECEALFCGSAVLSHRLGRSIHDLLHWLRSVLAGPSSYLMTMDVIPVAAQYTPEMVSEVLEHQWGSVFGAQLRSWVEAGMLDLGLFPVGIGRRAEEQCCPILPVVSNFLCHSLIQPVPSSEVKLAAWNGTLVAAGHSLDALLDVKQQICQRSRAVGLEISPVAPPEPLSEKPVVFKAFHLQQKLVDDQVYELSVKPRREAVEYHLQNLQHAFRLSEAFHEDKTGLLFRLSPIIEAFVYHFASADATESFSGADRHLHALFTKWARDQNPNLMQRDAVEKEFGREKDCELGFEVKTRVLHLRSHSSEQRIVPEAVDPERSPYDGDTAYWKNRIQNWEKDINPALLSLD